MFGQVGVAFWAEDADQFAKAAVDLRGQDFYTRYGNPNHAQVAAVVAELEQTEAAMVTASGMAALTTAWVKRHNVNGQALAEALEGHPAVARVHYPGLPSHPQHALAGKQMSGFGGVLALELAGGFEAADTFLSRLHYARRSASLGGVESLAVHPAAMWRGMLSEDQIIASGVPLGLVRLAAGTEDTPDLVSDVLAAADEVGKAVSDNLEEELTR